MSRTDTMTIGRCPLCDGSRWVEDSVSERNLYSEKLAELLGQEEQALLAEHVNCRCMSCGLLFKRRWFPANVIRALFHGAVAVHPKGWDAVLGRFSAAGFLHVVGQWADAVGRRSSPDIRRGERELLSILDSITHPTGFDPVAAAAAVREGRAADVLAAAAIAAAIHEPASFKRFAGFRSQSLWDYLRSKAGAFRTYAELGCPLWGLLPLAAEAGVAATFLRREEPNYWGAGCVNAGEHCMSRLLSDPRISSADWSAPDRYPLVGLFQYLDHLTEPRRFLKELFSKADSAAIIMDGIGAPVAIQHVTGWTEASFAYVARSFGKRMHADFADIRPSGNALYLLAGSS